MPYTLTPLPELLEWMAHNNPGPGLLQVRKYPDGDSIVRLPTGCFRRVRCWRSMQREHRKTKGLPINTPRVVIGTPGEWETAGLTVSETL